MRPFECTTCGDLERRGYCAPARCYCGHPACPAFASWVDLSLVPLADLPAPKKRKQSSSWDDRKESTWIDQL